jgi:GTP:adenosylcobinamide-phosphate guanylyltransferase
MFRKVRVKKIPETLLRQVDPELMSFFNINTAEDYSEAKQWLEQNQNHSSMKPLLPG